MQNLYILLSILLPVLSIYISPIPGLDLGTACILLLALFMFVKNIPLKLNIPLCILLVYTVLVSIPAILGLSINYSSEDIVQLRLARYIILIIIMLGVGYPTLFDERKYTKVYEVVSIVVSGYAIIQSFYYELTGMKLRNIFGQEKGGAVFSASLGEYEKVYRPPSFFLEPSNVTYFLTPILCYVLFCDKKLKSKNFLIAMFITIGILISTSGQGLLIVALCWGLWGLTRIKFMSIGGIFVFVFCSLLFLNTVDIGYTLSRITTEEELNAIDARAGGYEIVEAMSLESSIFGNGFGNYDETVYYSSIAEIIFCTGYVGLMLVFLLFLWFFIKGVSFQKVLVLSSLLLMVGGGIYTATYLCLYLPLLLPFKKAKIN